MKKLRLLSPLWSVAMLPGLLLGHGAKADDASRQPSFLTDPFLSGTKPAVDGLNGTLQLFGIGGAGTQSRVDGFDGAAASVSVPVGHAFGAQFDAWGVGRGGVDSGTVAGHFFWRDPDSALVGAYFDASRSPDFFRGTSLYTYAAESEFYLGKFTVSSVAGTMQWAAYSHNETYFLGEALLSYYPMDNLMASAGYANIFRKNVAFVGAEYLLSSYRGAGASLFAMVSAAEGGNYAGLAGIRVYFGQRDKTLIERHREDDPAILRQYSRSDTPDNLCALLSALGGGYC